MNKEYEIKKFEIHNEFIDDYHKNRIAFIVLDEIIHILKESNMSHLELYKSLGENDIDKFNNLMRGYFYQDYLVAYKGNFDYDDELINSFASIVEKIANKMKIKNCKVYVGLIQKKGEDGLFPPNKFIGQIVDGNFIS